MLVIIVLSVIFLGAIIGGLLVFRNDRKKQAKQLEEKKNRVIIDPKEAIREAINDMRGIDEYLIENADIDVDGREYKVPFIYLSKKGVFVIDGAADEGDIVGEEYGEYWMIAKNNQEVAKKSTLNKLIEVSARIGNIINHSENVNPLYIFTLGDLSRMARQDKKLKTLKEFKEETPLLPDVLEESDLSWFYSHINKYLYPDD